VLAEAEAEMPVKAIHAEVEQLLKGSASPRYSVSDYLLTRTASLEPLSSHATRSPSPATTS